MTRSAQHPWLNWFAWLTTGAAFLLLGLGGLVTSHEAGLTVPDWPNTYGYNMFLFPLHLWRGNVFYEHTHRLLASFVGLLTAILAVWLWLQEPRRSLRWLGTTAFFLVVVQGVLGGLRVTLLRNEIGIFHATLAQCFFVLLTLIALSVSGYDDKLITSVQATRLSRSIHWLVFGTTALILTQLALGATMRHQHAGLAVPDFPLAYGRIWPSMNSAFLDKINSRRIDVEHPDNITAFQIGLHMTHRIVAFTILLLSGIVAWRVRRETGTTSSLAKLALGWFFIICLQAILGAATVWSHKAADVATLHVLVGALSLLMGAIMGVGIIAGCNHSIPNEESELSVAMTAVMGTGEK